LFKNRFQKKHDGAIDVFLEHEIYSKFKAYQAKNSLDESTALVNVLERGMSNYWLEEFKRLKQGYLPMEKMFTEFKRDNELMKRIEQENEELKGIIEKVEKRNREAKA